MFACAQRKSAASAPTAALNAAPNAAPNAVPTTTPYYSLRLTHAERPRLASPIEAELDIRDGQNVVVAILTHYGYNTEDALVVCRESVEDFGDLHVSTVERYVLKSERPGQQILSNPDIGVGSVVNFITQMARVVEDIDNERETERNTERDAERNAERNAERDTRDIERDVRVIDVATHQNTNPGTITRFDRSDSLLIIEVTTEHPVRVGDKLASRFGQKGVVARCVSCIVCCYEQFRNQFIVIVSDPVANSLLSSVADLCRLKRCPTWRAVRGRRYWSIHTRSRHV